MAGEQLKPMAVNPGDPITSELMANLVSNINIINSLSSSAIQDDNSDKPNPGQVQVESGRMQVVCNTSNTGNEKIAFTKTFTTAPNVTLSVRHTKPENLATYKYQPVVMDLSVNGFTIQMQSLSSSNKSGGKLWVHWIAVS